MKNFLAELKRRNVHKGAIVYAVIAWLLIQVAFIPVFEVPSWAIKTLIVLLVLGFVAVVSISWAFEATPEGMKRTNEFSFAAINLHPRNSANMILCRHRRCPVDDVDLAHRDLRIAFSQLLNCRFHCLARPAPVRIEVHNGHVPKREMFADIDLLAMRDHFDPLTAIGHEFSLLDKDRWKGARATRLHYHEPAVFECRDLSLLRPVSSRHQLGRGFPRIELDALDAVRWVTGVFPIISSDFKNMIPIFCNRRFNFLAGAELNRICAANECGSKNKTAKYAPRISKSIHHSTVPLAMARATGRCRLRPRSDR